MRLFCGHLFLLSRRVLDSSLASVVRNVIGVLDDSFVHDRLVHVGHMNDIHVHLRHRGVIGEASAPPLAARKADAAETEAVVHAAVVAHGLAPIPAVEAILPVVPAPVRWRPQRAAVRGRHPRAGNPVVAAFLVVSPVTRRPHQVRLGARRLHIDRQHRRSKSDVDGHAKLRVHGLNRYRWDGYRDEQSKQK